MGLFNVSFPGASCGMVCETGILLVIATTLEFHSTAWFSAPLVVVSLVRQLYCRTGLPENGVLWVRKKKEKKGMTHLGAPDVVEPHSGPVVVVPRPYAHGISRV